jgi:hypothetical protein
MRIYQAVPEHTSVFTTFFREYLLPVQTKHGAELVGRWLTDDSRFIAIWRYSSVAEYERIQAAISKDPDSLQAQERRKTLPVLFTGMEESFMEPAI